MSKESRKIGTVTLTPNCKVKSNSVFLSFRKNNFLIDSMRIVTFAFISMPITFFLKSVNGISRGASKLCLRLRCLESCDAVVKLVDVVFVAFESAEGSFRISLSEVFTLNFRSDFGAMSLTKSRTSKSAHGSSSSR